LQPVALLIERDRLVEWRFALLERADDLLEPHERRLEAQLADVGIRSGGHEYVSDPRRGSNQGDAYSTGVVLNGSLMPGTTSSAVPSPLSAASAASASRACCSRSRRSSSINASRSPSKRVSWNAGAPFALAAFATAASSSRCVVRPSVTG